jgi:hypothetical protein
MHSRGKMHTYLTISLEPVLGVVMCYVRLRREDLDLMQPDRRLSAACKIDVCTGRTTIVNLFDIQSTEEPVELA